MIEACCECGWTKRVSDKYVGKRVKCPSCGLVVSIPSRPGVHADGVFERTLASVEFIQGTLSPRFVQLRITDRRVLAIELARIKGWWFIIFLWIGSPFAIIGAVIAQMIGMGILKTRIRGRLKRLRAHADAEALDQLASLFPGSQMAWRRHVQQLEFIPGVISNRFTITLSDNSRLKFKYLKSERTDAPPPTDEEIQAAIRAFLSTTPFEAPDPLRPAGSLLDASRYQRANLLSLISFCIVFFLLTAPIVLTLAHIAGRAGGDQYYNWRAAREMAICFAWPFSVVLVLGIAAATVGAL